MVERHKVEEFLYSSFSKVKRNGEGYVLPCPICGDSKKNPNKRRCHVDYYSTYDEWVYTCYNGGCPNPSGNIQSLYVHTKGCSYAEAYRELEDRIYCSDKIKSRLNKSIYIDEEDEIGELDLDRNMCYSLNDRPDDIIGQRYINILKDFHVIRRIPTKYGLLVCFNGKYKGRIIIPVMNDGNMVYFQGRSIYDHLEPKYLNPDVKKECIIFNRDVFDSNKYIVITEGLIDAMMVGNQGTSCLGARIDDNFLSVLFPLTKKGLIVALDNPKTDESGGKNYENIINESIYSKKLKYFFMPTDHKDLNDFVKEKEVSFLSEVYDFVVKNSVSHFKASMKIRNKI